MSNGQRRNTASASARTRSASGALAMGRRAITATRANALSMSDAKIAYAGVRTGSVALVKAAFNTLASSGSYRVESR